MALSRVLTPWLRAVDTVAPTRSPDGGLRPMKGRRGRRVGHRPPVGAGRRRALVDLPPLREPPRMLAVAEDETDTHLLPWRRADPVLDRLELERADDVAAVGA